MHILRNSIFICYGNKFIIFFRELKERHPRDGRLLFTWSRESIESCVKIGFDPTKIQINFTTIRKNLNQRIYVMNDDDAKVS